MSCINQEYQYKDFLYKIEDCKHIVEHNQQVPKFVYKYYGVNNYTIDALVNNYLYTSHPFQFNDSIDSSELLLDFSRITKERHINMYKRFLKPEEFTKHNWEKCFEIDKEQGFKEIKAFAYRMFSRNMGLISLTTSPLNILMWSHYATERGFAIELDIQSCINEIKNKNSDITESCFRPMQYVDKLESIDMFHDNFSTPDIPYYLYMTTVKGDEWKYENEWRLSIYKEDMSIPFSSLELDLGDYDGKNNRRMLYDKKHIKNIILGKYFFNGQNCEKLDKDHFFQLKHKQCNEDVDYIQFVNYLYENHNDHLYMSGELEQGSEFRRSVTQIKLERKTQNTFKINFFDKIYSSFVKK